MLEGYFGGDAEAGNPIDWPTINWGQGTGFGIYDSPMEHLEVVETLEQLPQHPPRGEDLPAWAFWFETNACWGLVYAKEHWVYLKRKESLEGYNLLGLQRANTTRERKGAPSFGSRSEHGGNTLRAWAKRHNLDWMLKK